MHFDTAVNHGVGAAIRMLQEAAGAVIDGEIGPETRAAIARNTPTGLVTRYADIRRAKYRALPHFWRFGRGWLRRADATLERALARGDQSSHVDQQKGTEPMQTDISGAPPKWWGQSMTIWGALITALATVAPAVGPVIGVDITGEVIRQAGGQAAQAFQAVAGLVGTVLTIWGRFRAVQPLAQRDVSFKF
ncbi:MAG: putative peptidoglycan-binding domain-containing protein [Hyphomicrobium sp.]